MNGDGYDDVILGAEHYSAYHSSDGQARVFHGGSAGVSPTAATTITGSAWGEMLGHSVSGAGDVNGDGYGDILVGVPHVGGSGGPGEATLHRGSATGVSSTAALTVTGPSSGYEAGSAVASAGDVNGDGLADFVVGAPVASTAWVYWTGTGADTGDTGSSDTGSGDTGDTGSSDTGSGDTGDTATGDTGSGETGETGAGDTGTGDSGDPDTGDGGSEDTGADGRGDGCRGCAASPTGGVPGLLGTVLAAVALRRRRCRAG